jgi:thymidine phosphorylase
MNHHTLKLRRLGIDTYTDPVIYMRRDCHVCRAEGFEARTRVRVALGERAIIATLNVVSDALLAPDEAGLSEFAWRGLGASEGAAAHLSHPEPVASESRLRAKVYGARLDAADMQAIVRDVVGGLYSDLHLAAFVTAGAGDRLDEAETVALTRAMVGAGERIRWDYPVVADKHSVGGLPGNRTTPLVVAMVAACGVPIPKTSSRAITSPAGTADTMEMLAPVDLDVPAMRRVVEKEGGCIVWGGAVRLSPADDVLIRVERPLDFDSDGQLVASVLSKKAAAGATHVVIDMPVGPTAKVRSVEAARSLSSRLRAAGTALGLQLRIEQTDGSQPVGRGIGPALEARDLLAVLQGRAEAPRDLRERSLRLAGAVLELAGAVHAGQGAVAQGALDDGRAWRKFRRSGEAQAHARAAALFPLACRCGELARDGRRLRQPPPRAPGEARGRAAGARRRTGTARAHRRPGGRRTAAFHRARAGAGRARLRARLSRQAAGHRDAGGGRMICAPGNEPPGCAPSWHRGPPEGALIIVKLRFAQDFRGRSSRRKIERPRHEGLRCFCCAHRARTGRRPY